MVGTAGATRDGGTLHRRGPSLLGLGPRFLRRLSSCRERLDAGTISYRATGPALMLGTFLFPGDQGGPWSRTLQTTGPPRMPDLLEYHACRQASQHACRHACP